MLAMEGYFDGNSFQALEKFAIKPKQRVIITVMDDFIDDSKIYNHETLEALREVEYMKKNPAFVKGWTDVDAMMEELLK